MPTPPPLPVNEPQRIAALHSLNILDTAEEEVYDYITAAAAEACDMPIALLSLVDSERQWCKSHHGVPWNSTSRDVSFCGHAICEPGILIVPDASQDERFRDNPLVLCEDGIRFYAGVPLRTDAGEAIGTLCLIDKVRRELTEQQQGLVHKLAQSAMRLISLRRQHGTAVFASAVNASADAIAIADATAPERPIIYANRSFLRLTGCAYHDVVGKPYCYPFDEPVRGQFEQALRERRGESVHCELARNDRKLYTCASLIPYVSECGEPVYAVVVHRDSTLEKEAEQQKAQLEALRVTMRSVNHIVLNFMNSASLFRHDMENVLDRAKLIQFDLAMESARRQLSELAGMNQFRQRKTSFGFDMLDPK